MRTFVEAREGVRAALAAMGSGDPRPYIDCWVQSEDATLFGAWGPIERGYPQLAETFHWVGGRFTTGALIPEDVVASSAARWAWMAGRPGR